MKRYATCICAATLIALLCVLAAMPGQAQGRQARVTNDPAIPLQIASASVTPDGNPTALELENTGEQAIVAYVVEVTSTLSNGKQRTKELLIDGNPLGLEQPVLDMAKPHTRFHYPFHGTSYFKPLHSDVTITDVEARVLYVETADHQVYGPEAKKFQRDLCFERSVRRGERDRLKKMMEKDGPDAVTKDLNRK